MRVVWFVWILAGVIASTPGGSADSEVSSTVSLLATRVPGFKWLGATEVKVDIDADGIVDTAILGTGVRDAALGVLFGPRSKGPRVAHLSFSAGGAAEQFGTCAEGFIRVEE